MKNVLVLGAGLVARPLVRYLLDRGFGVTCASRTVSKAEALVDGHPNGRAHPLNLRDEEKLAGFIAECDLAVSLVPFAFHPTVARMCIEHRKPMVTTSYVSPEMEELAVHGTTLILPEGFTGIAAGTRVAEGVWKATKPARPYAVWGEYEMTVM